jgi:hypothetical protein
MTLRRHEPAERTLNALKRAAEIGVAAEIVIKAELKRLRMDRHVIL